MDKNLILATLDKIYKEIKATHEDALASGATDEETKQDLVALQAATELIKLAAA